MNFNLCSFILIISFLSTTALFCSKLTSSDDHDAPCFLETPTQNPLVLRTAGNSLVLPCHVAHSKRSTVEWWYVDAQKLINIKIYPVFPAIRPTVLRLATSLSPLAKSSNESDVLDASILLRHVNVDDSGIYRCVIRPWTMDSLNTIEATVYDGELDKDALSYDVQLSAPRLCQTSPSTLPCFSAMRTSSPTIIDAYQTAFLQCVITSFNRPVDVFWVVGDAPVNSVLITDHLTTNQHNGDRLRRVFPLSPFDYSIELSVNRDLHERTYSCVIKGTTDVETTFFTYIVRTIDVEEVTDETKESKLKTLLRKSENIAAHDTLNHEQIHALREEKTVNTDEEKSNEEKQHSDEVSEDELQETST